MLRRIKHQFKLINKYEGFTEADKAQVKTQYIEHFVAPDAQDYGEEFVRSVLGWAANSKLFTSFACLIAINYG